MSSIANQKLTIAAVPYSDNLGDGVIAATLSAALKRFGARQVELCDISYRTHVVHSAAKQSRLFSAYLRAPELLRQAFVCSFFTAKYLTSGRRYLRERIQGAQTVLIGGGQLISDVDVNFPLKLYFVIREAEALGVPVKVIAVGVGAKWSWLGRAIMGRVLRSKAVTGVAVRDDVSRKNLEKFFGIKDTALLADPALLSAILLDAGKPAKAPGTPPVFALGVAAIDTLNHSSDLANANEGNGVEQLATSLEIAARRGYALSLFTNGAIEDHEYLERQVLPVLQARGIKVAVQPRFVDPMQLIEYVAGVDFLVAYRLHANIVAASLGVPSLAVAWDNKVRSFFQLESREADVFPDLAGINAELDHRLAAAAPLPPRDSTSLEQAYRSFLEV